MTALLLAALLALSPPARAAGGPAPLAQEIPAFRVKGTIAAGVFETLEVLLDIDRLRQWDTECLAAEILRRPSKTRMLWRYVSDVPWPVDDREAILWSSVTVSEGGKTVRIDFEQSAPGEEGVPAKTQDGQVRVPLLKGRWILTERGPAETHVDYKAKTSAGGSVPDWLVAQMGESSPRALLKGLAIRAEQVQASGMYAEQVKAWAAAP